MTSSESFNLTPDPKVLVALTHTPLKPMDALCELVDNALDGFRLADIEGNPVESPLVTIDLPGPAEVERGAGVVRVRDNGPGMTGEVAEKALKAGYSGNNPFDSLGLFGMGFNISTGKLGSTTVFRTARARNEEMLEVTIDLLAIQQAGSYDVPVSKVSKFDGFEHGTIVEVAGWWPKGNPNNGFVRKLAGYSKKQIREEIGRRYASLLRDTGVRVLVNQKPCEPYEHCVWSAERFVERAGHGQIPAKIELDEVVGTQRRCSACYSLVPAESATCLACGSSSFRTIEQRIRGWLGVQRFDDLSTFGVDLIRNGRAIRVAEKSAFFEFTDDFARVIKDYPIDQQYGRLVGEIHLDHVAVDFQKQDFQRSTSEWQQAITYLRGNSSLQPNQPGAKENQSPMFRLYQGYRKVRNFGTRDMYMGTWEPGADKPKRISRDVEREYFERFLNHEPGYHDDAEWWKLVEQADRPPMEPLAECPSCHAENLKSAEECQACGFILIGKDCRQCGERIPAAAQACPHCGQGQIPDDTTPWSCGICGNQNPWDVSECGECGYPRGAPPLSSPEYLRPKSQRADELCLRGCTVPLVDGSSSTPTDIEVLFTNEHIVPAWEEAPVPAVVEKSDRLTVFVDPRHDLFVNFDVRPSVLVAGEVAHFIYMQNQRLAQQGGAAHSVGTLTNSIISSYYAFDLDVSPERVKTDVAELFTVLRRALAEALSSDSPSELYEALTERDQEAFAKNLVASGRSLTESDTIISSGEFLEFLDPPALTTIVRERPNLLDGAGPGEGAGDSAIPTVVAQRLEQSISAALDDCAQFADVVKPSAALTRRARAALDYLRTQLGL